MSFIKFDLDLDINIKFDLDTNYDWSNVMAIALECLDNYFEDGKLHVELCIAEWLAEFEGWGLLFTLLPTIDYQKGLLFIYNHLKHKYLEENVVKSNEELFDEMLSFYEQGDAWGPFKQLIPKVEVELMNIVGGRRENERSKLLRIKFLSSSFHLTADFVVHKKALRRSLVEIAAEAVALNCEDVEDLEIPETLKGLVVEKVIDADWVASYWFAKFRENRAEEEKSGETPGGEESKQVVQFGSSVLLTVMRQISGGLMGLAGALFSLLGKGLWIE